MWFWWRVALISLSVAALCGACSVGHPVVGVVPGAEGGGDSFEASLLLPLALAGGGAVLTAPGPTTPESVAAVFLFSAGDTTGDVRGVAPSARQAADQLCQLNRPVFSPVNTCATVRGFISLTAADEIRDMPVNYGVPTGLPIWPPTGGAALQIAPDWNDLMNSGTPIERTLLAAGVTTFRWRSFSDTDGSLHANNCTGGTSTAGFARYGDTGFADFRWISRTNTFCVDGYRLLCVCF